LEQIFFFFRLLDKTIKNIEGVFKMSYCEP